MKRWLSVDLNRFVKHYWLFHAVLSDKGICLKRKLAWQQIAIIESEFYHVKLPVVQWAQSFSVLYSPAADCWSDKSAFLSLFRPPHLTLRPWHNTQPVSTYSSFLLVLCSLTPVFVFLIYCFWRDCWLVTGSHILVYMHSVCGSCSDVFI